MILWRFYDNNGDFIIKTLVFSDNYEYGDVYGQFFDAMAADIEQANKRYF